MSPSLRRQAHRKDRALARLARYCHVAAHHACELARDGEAEAGSAEAPRGRGIGLAELRKQKCDAEGGQWKNVAERFVLELFSLTKPCSDLALQSLQQRFRILHVRRIQAFSEPG